MTKQQQQQQAHEDDYVKQLDPYCTLHREITTRPILGVLLPHTEKLPSLQITRIKLGYSTCII